MNEPEIQLDALHYMLDLETLATSRDAAIIAIGAVQFNPVAGKIVDTFYRNVTAKSNHEAGRKIDPNTVEWWLQQSKEAQDALFAEPRVPLEHALHDFQNWIQIDGTKNKVMYRKGRLWSNGPTFDEVIIRDAFTDLGFDTFPISFRGSRCCRTIIEIAKALGLKKPEREGTRHNALDDARFQAEGVMQMFAETGIGEVTS